MRYESDVAFRAALEVRIKRAAEQDDPPSFVRWRKTVVFDRFLARLLVVAPNKWIVKGGVAIDLRLGDRARTTKDLDLGRDDDRDVTMEDLLAASEIDLDDYFQFTIEATAVPETDEHVSSRYHIEAYLAGRLFEAINLDIGFGDPLPENPDTLEGTNILAFAELPSIQVPVLPLEHHLAQKFHAYTRSYGGHQSTRVKDLVDMLLIQTIARLTAEALRSALGTTFQTRNTHELPLQVPFLRLVGTCHFADSLSRLV